MKLIMDISRLQGTVGWAVKFRLLAHTASDSLQKKDTTRQEMTKRWCNGSVVMRFGFDNVYYLTYYTTIIIIL